MFWKYNVLTAEGTTTFMTSLNERTNVIIELLTYCISHESGSQSKYLSVINWLILL